MFKIKQASSILETQFPDGNLLPEGCVEAAWNAARRIAEMDENDAAEYRDEEGLEQDWATMTGLRTGLADQFRTAVKEAWAQIATEAQISASLGEDASKTPAPPWMSLFAQRRRGHDNHRESGEDHLPEVPGARKDGDPESFDCPQLPTRRFAARDRDRVAEALHKYDPESGKTSRESAHATDASSAFGTDGEEVEEMAFLTQNSGAGAQNSRDRETGSMAHRRVSYVRRLQASTNNLSANMRSRQRWRDRTQLCQRLLGTLDQTLPGCTCRSPPKGDLTGQLCRDSG